VVHVPAWQKGASAGHVPQEPPHPSLPQSLPTQLDWQGGLSGVTLLGVSVEGVASGSGAGSGIQPTAQIPSTSMPKVATNRRVIMRSGYHGRKAQDNEWEENHTMVIQPVVVILSRQVARSESHLQLKAAR